MNPQDNPLYSNKNSTDSSQASGSGSQTTPPAQPFGSSPPPLPPPDPMSDIQGQAAVPTKAPPIGVPPMSDAQSPPSSPNGFNPQGAQAMPLHAPPLDAPQAGQPAGSGNPLFGGGQQSSASPQNQPAQPSQTMQVVEDDDDEAGLGLVVPQMASDSDLIEKEWVDKVKQLVESTKNDPHKLAKEINKMKAAYLKKRYQKDIKVPKD
jgi:hypothetical protein